MIGNYISPSAAAAESPDVVIIEPVEEDVITISSSSSVASSPSLHRRNSDNTAMMLEEEILANNNSFTNPIHNMNYQETNYNNNYNDNYYYNDNDTYNDNTYCNKNNNYHNNDYYNNNNNYYNHSNNNELNGDVPTVYDLVGFDPDEEMTGGGQVPCPETVVVVPVVDGLIFCPNCTLNFSTAAELESHFTIFHQPPPPPAPPPSHRLHRHHHQNTNVVPPTLHSQIPNIRQQTVSSEGSELFQQRVMINPSQEQNYEPPPQFLNSNSRLGNSYYERGCSSTAVTTLPFSTSSSSSSTTTTTTSTTTNNMCNSNNSPIQPSGFVCNFCGKAFPGRRNLNNHINIHTRPYSCQICSKNFGQKGSLTKHLKQHEKEAATRRQWGKIIPPVKNSFDGLPTNKPLETPSVVVPAVPTTNVIEIIDLSDDDNEQEDNKKKAIIIDKTSSKSCPNCSMTFQRSEIPLLDTHLKICRGSSFAGISSLSSFEEKLEKIVAPNLPSSINHHSTFVGQPEEFRSQVKTNQFAAEPAQQQPLLLSPPPPPLLQAEKNLLQEKEELITSNASLIQQQQQQCKSSESENCAKLCPTTTQKDEDPNDSPCDSKSTDSLSTESLMSIDMKPIQNIFDIKPPTITASELMDPVKIVPTLTVKMRSEDVKNISQEEHDDDDAKIKSPFKKKHGSATAISPSYVCKVCGDTFQLNYSFKRHVLTHIKGKKA